MCSSVEKCERILNTAEVMGMIPVIWTSSDFSVDAYFMTSFHNILDIMKNTPTIHVLVQVDYLVNNLIQIIQYAPQRSIFVIAHESSISLNICSFGSYNSNITKPFIFHLHHEMPWLGLGFNSECNATILSTYAKVFRNYYSRPWQGELSQYIPLGSTGARYIRWYNGRYGVKKSSDRLFWCNFIGRRGYTHTSPSPFHQQRNDLLDIIPNHNNEETIKPKSCEAYSDVDESGLSEGGPFTFDTYIWYLSETTFTLCPAGNSPETFRHYEALEVGSIPIMIRPPPDHDFISYSWKYYPGPIFDSWEEALQYVSSRSTEEIDELQDRIDVWYKKFRKSTNANFRHTFNHMFSIASSEYGDRYHNVFVEADVEEDITRYTNGPSYYNDLLRI